MDEKNPQKILERAIFGSWDEAGLKREPGLLEQATTNDKQFSDIRTQIHAVNVGLSTQIKKHDKALKVLSLLCLLPTLNALGINTKDVLPFILKNVLPLIGL